MPIRRTVFLAPLWVLVACEGGLFAPGDVNPPIRTSAEEYVLEATSVGWQTEIQISYTNAGDVPYFLPNCGGLYDFRLERWVGDEWVWAWGPAGPLCRSPVIRIQPGATFADTLWIFGGFPGSNTGPQFAFENPAGRYRIVIGALSADDESARPSDFLIPLALRVSNPFSFVIPE